MSRRWWLGAFVAAASTAMGALTASAQQPPLPGTPTVPQVTVPPVTAPPVTVPTVTVVPPGATTPPVSTPSATTPSATTPSVSGPSVSTSPGSSSSPAPSGGGGGHTGASAQPGAAAQPSGGGQSPAPQSPRSASGARQPSSDTAAPTQLRRHDRALRRTVLGHEGCLGRMPNVERRVLSLRAGVGIGHTRSRADVQRLTGLSRARVVAIERRGIVRLRGLARAGACASAAGTAAFGEITGGAADPRIADPKVAVLGERESNAGVTPPAPPPPPTGSPDAGRTLLHAPDSAMDFAPILLFVALAALVYAVVREARRHA
jgi:hypothetical protein